MAYPEDLLQRSPSEDSILVVEDPLLYHHPISPVSTSHTPLQPALHHQTAPMYIPYGYSDQAQNLFPYSYPQEMYYENHQSHNQVFGTYSQEQQQQVVPSTMFIQSYPTHPQLFHHSNIVLAPNDLNGGGTQGNAPTLPQTGADEIAARRAAVLKLRNMPEFMAEGNVPAHIQADLKCLYVPNSWPAGSRRGARGGKNSYTCMWPEGHCSKTITRRDHMVNHIKAHLGVKSFSCSLLKEDGQPCQSRFLRQDDLKRHNRIVHKKHRNNDSECDGNSSSPTVNRKKHKRRISTSSSSSSNGSMISFPVAGYCKSENDDADYQPQPTSSYPRQARRYGTSMSFQCLCVTPGWAWAEWSAAR